VGAERVDVSKIDVDGGTMTLNGLRKPLAQEDLSVLTSILSLKPEVREGRYVFPFSPPTLLGHRRLLRVRETERSRGIRARAGSPIAGVTVDYKPDVGVIMALEFADADGRRVEGSAVERGDGYLKMGDTFYLLDEAAERALSLSEKPVDLRDIPEFFLRDLVLLRSEFSAVLTDRVRKISITEDYITPTVLINYSEPGWLDFNVVYDPRKEDPGLPVSRDGQYVRTDEYTWAKRVETQRHGDEEHLKRLGAKKTEKGYRLGLHAYKSLEEFIEEIGSLKRASEDYREFLDRITDFKGDDAYRLPARIEEHLESHGRGLFPYQRSGIQWLNWLFEHNLHGLLADDMGLGKTLQSLVSMRYMYEETGASEPSLVICPVAVMRHWEKEIAAVFPRSTVVSVYHGQGRQLEPPDGKRVIYVSSYDTVVADIEELRGVAWFFVILDEGTRIKNPGTQRAGAVKTLNAAHKLALSGTPIENRPAELWSLFDFLMRDHLGTYHEFLWRYEKPIVEGDAAQVEELKRRVIDGVIDAGLEGEKFWSKKELLETLRPL
jgi:SNF2 family DNA or RNA helicase